MQCRKTSPLLELALVLLRFDHFASLIINANHFVIENSILGVAYCMRLIYADMAHVKNTFYADAFLAYILQPA
jgi:hypothetical protein